jgi:DNA-binding transcriptional regulator LsrR (DeoR family)
VNLAELAKLRWIEGWSRKKLAEHYGRTEDAIQNYFQKIKKKDITPL